MTGDRYQDTLVKLRMAFKAKRLGMQIKGGIFIHDNAHPHRKGITHLLDDFNWEIVNHPAYSLDVAPSDYHKFPGLKRDLAGKWFANEANLKAAVSPIFAKMGSAWYAQGIEKLIFRYNKCLNICVITLTSSIHFP